MKAALVVIVLLFAVVSSQVTPTLVPFGGISAGSLPSTSFGQAVNGISDIVSFTLHVACVSGPGGDVATASIAPWGGASPFSSLKSVSVTLPTANDGYTPVTAPLNLQKLDPQATYVIYFTVPSKSKYVLFTKPTNSIGGYVTAVGSSWSSGKYEDCVFSLAFDSLLQINPDTNYATSRDANWYCLVTTGFSCMQVNWQTMKINTNYPPCRTNKNVRYGSSSCMTSTFAPYGSCSACWDKQYQMAWTYGNCDLTGTPYGFGDDAWLVGVGFLSDGAAAYSNNNQVVNLNASGDCGFTFPKGMPDDMTGAFCLPIVRKY